MKNRIEPTHFIEVYKHRMDNDVRNGDLMTIDRLRKALNATLNVLSLQTIAIWKIKAKN